MVLFETVLEQHAISPAEHASYRNRGKSYTLLIKLLGIQDSLFVRNQDKPKSFAPLILSDEPAQNNRADINNICLLLKREI